MAQTTFTRKPLPGPAPPAPRWAKPEGFSLLEVLVATTIMGLVLVVLLQVLTSALRAQEASWGNTQAVLVAEKVLQENCEIAPLTGGTYQGRDGRYDYVVRITPQYELANPFADKRILCSLIQVTLTWQEWGRPKTLELQTIRTAALKVL
jgi:prepilin-type N-terminal cleavage/methylation domain-containing protein